MSWVPFSFRLLDIVTRNVHACDELLNTNKHLYILTYLNIYDTKLRQRQYRAASTSINETEAQASCLDVSAFQVFCP
jgi:hypothetical protein